MPCQQLARRRNRPHEHFLSNPTFFRTVVTLCTGNSCHYLPFARIEEGSRIWDVPVSRL
jgi:hypothetical protein